MGGDGSIESCICLGEGWEEDEETRQEGWDGIKNSTETI